MNPAKARILFGDSYVENVEDVPTVELGDWSLVIAGFESKIIVTSQDILRQKLQDIHTQFECEWCDQLPYTYSGINFMDLLDDTFILSSGDAIGIEVYCYDGYENFLSNDQIFFGGFYLAFLKDGKPIPHIKGGPVRGVFKHAKGKYSPRYLSRIKFVTNSRHDPRDPRYIKI
jgi:DMSO/TMAO reductase YedYZ molybdopterin-dependent catalytic subunit